MFKQILEDNQARAFAITFELRALARQIQEGFEAHAPAGLAKREGKNAERQAGKHRPLGNHQGGGASR
jgi:hypothetical protein